jgi:hypothetical protein
MARLWHILVVIGFAFTVALVSAVESGIEPTVAFFVPLVSLVGVGSAGYFILKVIRSRRERKAPEWIRGGISNEEAKFAAASYLLNHHSVDIFLAGTTPKTAKYSVHMTARRCYPSPGEEAWAVRLILRDKRHFNGFLTKVMIFLDGAGTVTSDEIMNELTYLDNRLWRDPEQHFLRGASKTAKPRPLSGILARYVEETGEFPSDLHPAHLEKILEKDES